VDVTVLHFDTIDSTNTEALKQARLGAEEGLCIVARQQTAGRGRHGRVWVSEKDAGLYFSIVLRPKFDTQYLPLITLMAGVAVHDALSEFGIEADIKWVNDLLVGERKICGILAETTETNRGLAVIVGIGVNLKSSNFPPEITETASSIEEELTAAGNAGNVSGDVLAETLTRYISYFYALLDSTGGPAAIVEEWRRRSSYFSGKRVRVVLEGEAVVGTTDGLEQNGALRLRTEDGQVQIVQAGDVERVRPERMEAGG
jgi:BirA family transcriptional regulator, biotin operon repressor / biotin---[acetyl-CoA-carboxylase] ligase